MISLLIAWLAGCPATSIEGELARSIGPVSITCVYEFYSLSGVRFW